MSVLVFEARREGAPTRAPGGSTAAAIEATQRVWSEIVKQEGEHRLPPTREPDPGFAGAVGAWARGSSLAEALTVAVAGGAELSAGDFVRWCRQVIDLLDQLAGVAPAPLDATARAAVGALRRGVVSVGAV